MEEGGRSEGGGREERGDRGRGKEEDGGGEKEGGKGLVFIRMFKSHWQTSHTHVCTMGFPCTHTLKGLHENGCKPFDCMANSTWKCSEDNNEQSMPCPTVPFWQVQLPFQVGAHTYCKLRLKQKD